MTGYCADIELVYNAIIALAVVQPYHDGGAGADVDSANDSESLVSLLCDKLSGTQVTQPSDKHSALRLRL